MSEKESSIIAGKLGDNSSNNDEIEPDFKSFVSNVQLEIGDEFLMNIKEEDIDIKDEVPTDFSFHSVSDQDVDCNAPSVNYQKPKRKRDSISNESVIKSEIRDEILINIKEEYIDVKDEATISSSFHSDSNQDIDGNVASVSYQQPNWKRGRIEYDFKSNESNIKLELGDEIFMNIKEETIDIKDEVSTASSLHNDSDQNVDGNVASCSYQKPNRKHGGNEYGVQSNESDIKSEIGEEILMDIKEEEIYIKDEVPTSSSFHNDSDQDVDGNVAAANLYKSHRKNRQYLLTDYKTREKNVLVCNICGYTLCL